MLREIKNPRQIEGDPPRRWFFSETMELVLWLSDDRKSFRGFQLIYPAAPTPTDSRDEDMENGNEHQSPAGSRKVLTYLDGAFSHEGEDDGEDRPFRYKMTPISVADGALDAPRLARFFEIESQGLDNDVRDFVLDRLAHYDD